MCTGEPNESAVSSKLMISCICFVVVLSCFFVPQKVHFFAVAVLKQVGQCSFGLRGTFFLLFLVVVYVVVLLFCSSLYKVFSASVLPLFGQQFAVFIGTKATLVAL